MSDLHCIREDELLDALGKGFVPRDLEDHANACDLCGELRTVATALLDERAVATREAEVPSSTSMWLHMQMRHRHDVEAAARRSLLTGQALTLGIALVLVALFLGTDVLGGVRQLVASISTPLLIAIGTTLVMGPIAGFVAVRQK